MKLILIAALALALAGCTTTQVVVKTQLTTAPVPTHLLNACPSPPPLPKTSTLRDIQVAKAFAQAYGNNKKCYAAMQAVKRYLENAEKTVQQSHVEASAFVTEGALP